jgi:hypothetical protein
MLGDEQFAAADAWEGAGRLALVGIGVEPGLSDVFARYAADHLFSEIDELGTRDGSNLTVEGYDFAPSFSIWTTIEECLNPPLIWERDRGFFTTEPVQRARGVRLPRAASARSSASTSSTRRCVLMPRWVDCEAGDVQVRPRRRVHRRPQAPSTSSGSTHRPGHGAHARRAVAVSPPRRGGRGACPTRPASAT